MIIQKSNKRLIDKIRDVFLWILFYSIIPLASSWYMLDAIAKYAWGTGLS